MNVVYCAIIGIPDGVLLAETKNINNYYENLVSPLINKLIRTTNILDSYEIEENRYINFVKHKNKILLLCISKDNINSEKYKTFFTRFKDILLQNFGSIQKAYPENPSDLCLQERLNPELENLIKAYGENLYTNKGMMSEMNHNLDVIKGDMSKMITKVVNDYDGLNDLELKAKLINNEAKIFQELSHKVEYESKCMKPWMWVLMIIFVILLIGWICFCLTRCWQFFNPFC
jgi:hypothetical protein